MTLFDYQDDMPFDDTYRTERKFKTLYLFP